MTRTSTRPLPSVPDEVRAKYEGKRGSVDVEGLNFSVQITSLRNRFGHFDALVRPVSGDGEKWVETSRITLTGE